MKGTIIMTVKNTYGTEINFEKICYDEICDTYRRMADFLQD